jgi:hypothetical protein
MSTHDGLLCPQLTEPSVCAAFLLPPPNEKYNENCNIYDMSVQNLFFEKKINQLRWKIKKDDLRYLKGHSHSEVISTGFLQY